MVANVRGEFGKVTGKVVIDERDPAALREAGVSEASTFPDLDGLARDIAANPPRSWQGPTRD